MVYKATPKMIVKRLKFVLPIIVPKNQSAFVADRLIKHNIIVAFEVAHYLRRKTQGKNGVGVLKVDISKAYDCIN